MLKLILYNIFRKLRALAKLGNINCSVTLRPESRNRSLSLRERGVSGARSSKINRVRHHLPGARGTPRPRSPLPRRRILSTYAIASEQWSNHPLGSHRATGGSQFAQESTGPDEIGPGRPFHRSAVPCRSPEENDSSRASGLKARELDN